jgi:hypothetical protein
VGRDSVAGIATNYDIESGWGWHFPHPSGPDHPAFYTVGIGTFSGVKRPGHGADHPPHLAPKLEKVLSYTSTSLFGWTFPLSLPWLIPLHFALFMLPTEISAYSINYTVFVGSPAFDSWPGWCLSWLRLCKFHFTLQSNAWTVATEFHLSYIRKI